MELEDHLFFLCTQVVYRRDRALNDVLKPLGLLATEWRTLGTLVQRGPLAMQELARWTAYDRTRLTRIVQTMQERAWVQRTASEHDGRSVVVRIGRAGRAMYRRAEQRVEALTDEVMQVCPPADIDRVRRSLQAMRQKLIAMSY